MKAYRTERKFQATPAQIAQAIDSITSAEKVMTVSWSGDRKRVAILKDITPIYYRAFRGLSLIITLYEDGTLIAECAETLWRFWPGIPKRVIEFTHGFIQRIEDRLQTE
jgi:hypothetical protein